MQSANAVGHTERSSDQKREVWRTAIRQVLPSPDRNRKLFECSCWPCRQEVQIDTHVEIYPSPLHDLKFAEVKSVPNMN